MLYVNHLQTVAWKNTCFDNGLAFASPHHHLRNGSVQFASKRHAVRNHTAVALSFYAGLRACEIAGLRISDVFDEAGAVRDTIYLRAAQTKGSAGNTVLVNKRLAAALKRYAAAYPNRPALRAAKMIFRGKLKVIYVLRR
jgi:integrase